MEYNKTTTSLYPRLRAILLTGFLSLCAACAAAFMAVRFQAFASLAWGLLPPDRLVWAAAAVAAAAGLAAGTRIACYLKSISRKSLSGFMTAVAFSAFSCTVLRGMLIVRPLAGTGVTSGVFAHSLSFTGAVILLAAFLYSAAGAIRRGLRAARRTLAALTAKDTVFLGILIIAMNIFAYLYIHSARTIYFGDNAGYWTKSHGLALTAREGLVPLLKNVYKSILTQDYNNLIILPWVPLVLLFGQSRWVFIAAVVNLALAPVFILLYFSIKARCHVPALAAGVVICMLPMLFYTAVTGFIDVAGVIPALGAVLLWLGSRQAVPERTRLRRRQAVKPGWLPSENNRNTEQIAPPGIPVSTPSFAAAGAPVSVDWYRFFAVGCLLALTVLLRRWYAFYAVSFFIASIIDALFFSKRAAPLFVSAAAFAFTLLFFFQPFVSGLLLRNYAALYSAFAFDLSVDVRYILYYFGMLVLLALGFGLVYQFRSGCRRQAVFLLVQPLLCFVVFTRVQSHGQQHLLLYIPALLLAAAYICAGLVNRLYAQRRSSAAAALGAVLAISAILPMSRPLLLKTRPNTITDIKAASVLPSFIYVPPVRTDADTVVRLVRYLDETVGEQEKTVGILASSLKLNLDILSNAENSLNMKRISDVDRGYLVWLPEIDSRDAFPGQLLECDYLLVIDPVQVQLGPEKQRCIALPAEMLLGGTGIGKAYRPVDDVFRIGDGSIKVFLFERLREISTAEKELLLNEYQNVSHEMMPCST